MRDGFDNIVVSQVIEVFSIFLKELILNIIWKIWKNFIDNRSEVANEEPHHPCSGVWLLTLLENLFDVHQNRPTQMRIPYLVAAQWSNEWSGARIAPESINNNVL